MRQRFIEAAREVFRRRNPMEITMHEISTEAGLAKGTIYLYFQSKDELFIEMFRDCMAHSREELARFLEEGAALGEEVQLRRFLDFTLDDTMSREAMWGIWYQFLAMATSPRYRTLVLEIACGHRRERNTMVAAILERGKRSGVFRPEVDAELTVATLFALLDGFMLQVFTGTIRDLHAVFNAAAQPVLEGISARPAAGAPSRRAAPRGRK